MTRQRSGIYAAGAVLAAVALGGIGPGCVVRESEDDLLKRVYACEKDSDCIAGWQCGGFAMDPEEGRYCVQPCDGDASCDFGDFCGPEGFCMEPCDLENPSCREETFHCLRMNMTSGEQAGYCQPASLCSTFTDCGQDFDLCLAEIIAAIDPEATLEGDANMCVQSCASSSCVEGYVCITEQFEEAELALPEGVPAVCAPKCGENSSCPIGFRCLIDALEELDPEGDYSSALFNFCVPGIPVLELPCQTDRHCLAGHCVAHPDLPTKVCALPCDGGGDCSDIKQQCRSADHDGTQGDYCLEAKPLRTCVETADCEPGDLCLDWRNVGGQKLCVTPCSGVRDPVCSAGFACLPSATQNAGAQVHGCYFGFPGYPCDDTGQCHQDFGEGTSCLGPSGDALDVERFCTRGCTQNSQCDFGGLGGYHVCHEGHCQPIGFSCLKADEPRQCNRTLQCEQFLSPDNVVCTLGCPGLRPSREESTCPDSFGCGGDGGAGRG